MQTPITKLHRGQMRWPVGCVTPFLLISACYSFTLGFYVIGKFSSPESVIDYPSVELKFVTYI